MIDETYTPDFSDPRVITRLKLAYGFARGCLHPDKPRQWSRDALNNAFGRSNNNLGWWLRETLLICTDSKFAFGYMSLCKKYVVSEEGLTLIKTILRGKGVFTLPSTQPKSLPNGWSPDACEDYSMVREFALREHLDELGDLKFQYKDQSGRLWNGLQCVRTEYREQLMAEFGLVHNYDIQACAPTLIHQFAQKLGMDDYLFGIRDYLKNKKEFRAHVASLIGNAEKTEVQKASKMLINSLFCGAKLGANPRFSLFGMLGGDAEVIARLQNDKRLKTLRADVKKCWQEIEPTRYRVFKTDKNGRSRKVPFSPRRKWGVYFDLERTVLDSVRKFLNATGNRCFLEHDGWRTERPIDMDKLLEHVKTTTGFVVKIDYTEIEAAPVLNSHPTKVESYDNNQTIWAPWSTVKTCF